MPLRHSAVPNLDLSALSVHDNSKISSPRSPGAQSSDGHSPLTPKSSASPPFTKGTTIRPVTQDLSSSKSASSLLPISPSTTEPRTPGVTAIPQFPPSPKESPRHTRDASRSLFANLKAPKSSHRAQRSDSSESSVRNSKSRGSSRDRRTQISSKRYESTPDLLGAVKQAEGQEKHERQPLEKNTQLPDLKKTGTDFDSTTLKKTKPRFANLLSRSRSIRLDDTSVNRSINRRPSTGLMKLEQTSRREVGDRPKTPLVRQDRSSKAVGNALSSANASERPLESGGAPLRKERSYGGTMVSSGSLSQVSGASASLFNNIKQSSTGAADRIGKAGKGFFGKITRSGSTNERELVTDDNYVCSVINLPLIEQSRRTRIAKRLGDCRDKTEFWMPALPYRCVDYLNFKGCEVEGLYRIPGSGREVKHWQRRFDTELDVDLFEEPDLYDINTIGSLFKAWLRELPDELFPKDTQAMIAEKCEGATTAPQLLRDELSKLPPYNYYLLFAITCHLNLLHTYVDQNKMDYRNLCICFQPCMKIDAFCFYFLVCDWKNCWQGCHTEKEFAKKEEEANEREAAARSKAETSPQLDSESHSTVNADERAVSSSGSSHAGEEPARPETSNESKPKPARIETSHARSISQLPELGPPLSPIQI